ncbi:MAG: DUF1223 domain-containing protein [Thiolinea sp.]
MKHTISGLLISLALSSALAATAQAKSFSSDIRATDTVELYTSEGCSSCPPADRWFSTLKDDPGLFKDFIPLAFHVDYWNSLGWTDRFSSPAYTTRQHRHVNAGNTRQSYTPQVVLNNQEWRGHLRGISSWDAGDRKTGVLKAELDDANQLKVNFSPASPEYFEQKQWQLNVAYLGMGLTTSVQRGENSGRELKHDFVVLEHRRQAVDAEAQQWQLDMSAAPDAGQQQTALVVWLSDPVTQHTLQAAGGYL